MHAQGLRVARAMCIGHVPRIGCDHICRRRRACAPLVLQRAWPWRRDARDGCVPELPHPPPASSHRLLPPPPPRRLHPTPPPSNAAPIQRRATAAAASAGGVWLVVCGHLRVQLWAPKHARLADHPLASPPASGQRGGHHGPRGLHHATVHDLVGGRHVPVHAACAVPRTCTWYHVHVHVRSST